MHTDTPTALMPKLIATAGLPHTRPHDLRHLHATTLLLAGVPVHVVAAPLGHADPAITLRVYAESSASRPAGSPMCSLLPWMANRLAPSSSCQRERDTGGVGAHRSVMLNGGTLPPGPTPIATGASWLTANRCVTGREVVQGVPFAPCCLSTPRRHVSRGWAFRRRHTRLVLFGRVRDDGERKAEGCPPFLEPSTKKIDASCLGRLALRSSSVFV
jgi:hypothetical protein